MVLVSSRLAAYSTPVSHDPEGDHFLLKIKFHSAEILFHAFQLVGYERELEYFHYLQSNTAFKQSTHSPFDKRNSCDNNNPL